MKLYSVAAYLLLVSFMSGTAKDFKPWMAEAIKSSPYDGIAVQYAGAYDPEAPGQGEQERLYKEIARTTGKQVWPWIFWNGLVGYGMGIPIRTDDPKMEYYRKIKVLDIYNGAGELEKFMDRWCDSLKTARDTGAPGIVFDLEPYNNYSTSDVRYVADLLDLPQVKVRERMQEIGARMADVSAGEYPDAKIWLFFSGLSQAKQGAEEGIEYRTTTFLVMGMLDRCREMGYRITVVTGGEATLAYCYKDLDELRGKVAGRGAAYKDVLTKYPNLKLGGTISPWMDASKRSGWMTEGACGQSKLNKAEDFVPLFAELMKTYGYVWIYAAGVSDYRPYSTDASGMVNDALKAARAEAR